MLAGKKALPLPFTTTILPEWLWVELPGWDWVKLP